MRTISTDLDIILKKAYRRVDVRVWIKDGDDVFQNLASLKGEDWVLSVEWGDDIDAESSDAVVTIGRERYNDSMAPLHKTSRLNLNSGGSWDPLIFLYREFYIEVRYAPVESDPLPWIEVFRGRVDSISWADWKMTFTGRSKFMGQLQDTFIETETLYGSSGGTAVQTVMQDILDDVFGVSVISLYTPTSPGWNVTEFWSEKQSVANELAKLADMIGWRVKDKWDSGTSAFRLTLFEPDRSKVTIDRTFTMDDYYEVTNLEVDVKNIRNAITVTYPDPLDLDENGAPKAKSTTRTNPASIALYGRRWMGVTEDASSLIDTLSEAQSMADVILDDLKVPKTTKQVDMPLFVPVEIDDLYTFTANEIHYTDDFTAAVVSYRHTISDGEARTTLGLREDAPAGRWTSWYYLAAEAGIAPTQSELASRIANLSVAGINTGFSLSWEWNNPTTGSYSNSKLGSATVFEIYATAPGVSPTPADLVGITKETSYELGTDNGLLPVDEDLDFHVRAVTKGQASAYLTATNKRALTLGTAALAPTAFSDGVMFNFNEKTKGTDYVTDGWAMTTGTWNTDALLDDGTDFNTVTPQYGQQFLLLK